MKEDNHCRNCGTELECLGGRSAPPANWHCPKCGTQDWWPRPKGKVEKFHQECRGCFYLREELAQLENAFNEKEDELAKERYKVHRLRKDIESFAAEYKILQEALLRVATSNNVDWAGGKKEE